MNKIVSLKNIKTQNEVSKSLNGVGITLEMLACNKVQIAWTRKGKIQYEIFPFRIRAKHNNFQIIPIGEDEFSIGWVVLENKNDKVEIIIGNGKNNVFDTDPNSISIKFI